MNTSFKRYIYQSFPQSAIACKSLSLWFQLPCQIQKKFNFFRLNIGLWDTNNKICSKIRGSPSWGKDFCKRSL